MHSNSAVRLDGDEEMIMRNRDTSHLFPHSFPFTNANIFAASNSHSFQDTLDAVSQGGAISFLKAT